MTISKQNNQLFKSVILFLIFPNISILWFTYPDFFAYHLQAWHKYHPPPRKQLLHFIFWRQVQSRSQQWMCISLSTLPGSFLWTHLLSLQTWTQVKSSRQFQHQITGKLASQERLTTGREDTCWRSSHISWETPASSTTQDQCELDDIDLP